jgi:hypothetical protein
MAFVASLNSRFYVASAAWAAYARGYSQQVDTDMLEITTLADAAKAFIPGQLSGTVSLDLLLDTAAAAGGEFATMNTWKTTPQVVTFAPRGTTRGNETWNILANQSQASVMSAVADVVTAAVTIQADGSVDAGVVLDPETAITANTNGTSVDNGAATTNGGVGHLHVTAFSGLTSDSVVVEHSTDNSAWSTLATFTSVTGTTSERLVVAAGTTVNRYLRIRDAVTGTGSCTRFVSFARR